MLVRAGLAAVAPGTLRRIRDQRTLEAVARAYLDETATWLRPELMTAPSRHVLLVSTGVGAVTDVGPTSAEAELGASAPLGQDRASVGRG